MTKIILNNKFLLKRKKLLLFCNQNNSYPKINLINDYVHNDEDIHNLKTLVNLNLRASFSDYSIYSFENYYLSNYNNLLLNDNYHKRNYSLKKDSIKDECLFYLFCLHNFKNQDNIEKTVYNNQFLKNFSSLTDDNDLNIIKNYIHNNNIQLPFYLNMNNYSLKLLNSLNNVNINFLLSNVYTDKYDIENFNTNNIKKLIQIYSTEYSTKNDNYHQSNFYFNENINNDIYDVKDILASNYSLITYLNRRTDSSLFFCDNLPDKIPNLYKVLQSSNTYKDMLNTFEYTFSSLIHKPISCLNFCIDTLVSNNNSNIELYILFSKEEDCNLFFKLIDNNILTNKSIILNIIKNNYQQLDNTNYNYKEILKNSILNIDEKDINEDLLLSLIDNYPEGLIYLNKKNIDDDIIISVIDSLNFNNLSNSQRETTLELLIEANIFKNKHKSIINTDPLLDALIEKTMLLNQNKNNISLIHKEKETFKL